MDKQTQSIHTPGPWRVGDAGHTIFGPKESSGKLPQRIGDVCGVREDYLANARLIAAAPDLLAALAAVMVQFHSLLRCIDCDDVTANDVSAMAAAKAALAKVQL